MRFWTRFFLGLCLAGGVLSSVEGATVKVYNYAGVSVNFAMNSIRISDNYNLGSVGGGSCGHGAFVVSSTISSSGAVRVMISASGGGGGTYQTPPITGDVVFTFWGNNSWTTGQGTPPEPYYAYHVQWTNSSPLWAKMEMFITDTNGVDHYPENQYQASAVPPAKSVDFWMTNSVGGLLVVGDTRPEGTAPDGFVYPVVGYSNTGQNGTSGNVGTQQPLVPTLGSGQGGGTNGASQADIYASGAAIVKSVAAMEKTVDARLGSIQGTLNGMATNLSKGVGTNGSDYSGVLGDIKTNVANLEMRDEARMESLEQNINQELVLSSNYTGLASNYVKMSGIENAAEYFGTARGGLTEAMGVVKGKVMDGQAPPSGFGVLKVFGVHGEVTHTWDLKPVFAGIDGNGRFDGIKMWVRLVIMWACLIGVMLFYMQELRMAIRDALSPPSAQTNAMVLGAISAVPMANIMVRGAVMIAIVVGLAFIPSLMVATAGTVLSFMGETVYSIAASSTTVVNAVPSPVWTMMKLLGEWLPAMELMIFGLNYAVVRLGLDAAVSGLMMYVKAVGS